MDPFADGLFGMGAQSAVDQMLAGDGGLGGGVGPAVGAGAGLGAPLQPVPMGTHCVVHTEISCTYTVSSTRSSGYGNPSLQGPLPRHIHSAPSRYTTHGTPGRIAGGRNSAGFTPRGPPPRYTHTAPNRRLHTTACRNGGIGSHGARSNRRTLQNLMSSFPEELDQTLERFSAQMDEMGQALGHFNGTMAPALGHMAGDIRSEMDQAMGRFRNQMDQMGQAMGQLATEMDAAMEQFDEEVDPAGQMPLGGWGGHY